MITVQEKLLNLQDIALSEIKEAIHLVEQRVCNLEMKMEHVEIGQGTIEESLAYVNKYLIDKV